MGGYWYRALDAYGGNIFSMDHWTSLAPFYHLYLFEVFKLLKFLNLFQFKLEIILFMNIIYATISIFAIYIICKSLSTNFLFSLTTTGFYAFIYPLIYFNAMILTENFSIPLLIIAVCLLLTKHDNVTICCISALFLGIASAARPSVVPIVLSFFIYIIFANKISGKSITRAMIFLIMFSFFIVVILSQINYISKGQAKSLYSGSGATFFLIQCKKKRLECIIPPYHHVSSPPFNIRQKRWTLFKADHYMHDQKYFYKLGYECLKKNPNWFLDFICNLRAFYIDSFFPSFSSAFNFNQFIIIYSYLIFFMSISLGLLYYIFRDNLLDRKRILFFLSIPLYLFLMSFFHPPEQRYLCQVLFIIDILFFVIVFNFKNYVNRFLNYYRFLFVFYFIYILFK